MLSSKIFKLVAIAIVFMFAVSPVASIGNLYTGTVNTSVKDNVSLGYNTNVNSDVPKPDLTPNLISYTTNTVSYNPNWDFIKYLKDNPNDFKKIWEPWITKAAVHSIVVSDDQDTIAFGGGYLYDNEIHIYRWNYQRGEYEKAWDSGDSIIGSDVLSLAYNDTDHNKLKEIIAGSADGYVYVFEQRHIFDPITNMENIYELVWKSPYLGPVWSVKVDDLDRDFMPEIIAGTWDNKVYMFEYSNHSRYPFAPEHWIEYREIWNSGDTINDLITSMDTGDYNGNGLPDLLVGTRSGAIYLFENNGTVIDVRGYDFPLTQDNSFKLIWMDNYSAFAPIMSISTGDTDFDGVQEASIVAATQGAYILNYNKKTGEFKLEKLFYNIKSWEKGSGAPIGDFPVDYWMDWSLRATNVFYENSTGTVLKEPIPLSDAQSELKYLNTAMGGETDGKYSQFLPNATHNASALLDFGAQEEAVGDGTNDTDIRITFRYPTGFDTSVSNTSIKFYVSMNGIDFVEVTDYQYSYQGTIGYLDFDLDSILNAKKWRYVRYLEIVVFQGHKYAIDSIHTNYIEKQLTDVVSTLITDINYLYQSEERVILYGTIQGNLLAFKYNRTSGKYYEAYNSLDLDNFYLGTHIWFIAKTKDDTKFPYWIYDKKQGVSTIGSNITSYDLFDVSGDGVDDLIVGTDTGEVKLLLGTSSGFIYDSTGTNGIFGGANSYFSAFAQKDISVSMGDVLSFRLGQELLVGAYVSSSGVADIHILWKPSYYSTEYNYTRMITVSRYDITGKYSTIFYGNFRLFTDIADIDGDGNNDIIVTGGSDGNIYLIRNLGYTVYFPPPNQYGGPVYTPKFALDETYFAGINELKGNKELGEITVVDFNNDGLLDIVASYRNKKGGTYFENVGTKDNPEWIEKKTLFVNSAFSTNPVTNLAFNNHTLLKVYKQGDKYNLYTLKIDTNEFYKFAGDTSKVNTFLLATYPLMEKINIAPISTESKPLNYGYHVISVWNTRSELRGWTQAVKVGDIDGDGKGEVAIGDFDNNAYIFEHLRNNTYKRAFRSPDLTYEYETNINPYYSDKLGGLEHTFKMRVWEHARYIETNVDVDSDGKLELMVVTGLQVFIFEHIGYENYKLAYKISLLDHPIGSVAKELGGITAFAYLGDIDYDGLGDIALAVGQYLLIFQLTEAGNFVETFGADLFDAAYNYGLFTIYRMYRHNGEYYDLPGTGTITEIEYYNIDQLLEKTQKMKINALAVADMDNNGLKEIFVGGEVACDCGGFTDGFLFSIEADMGTMYIKWNASWEYMYQNPVNELTVSDMDYDGLLELSVAGEKGIDVFEADSTSYLKPMSTISSTPYHPYKVAQRVIQTQSFINDEIYDYDIIAISDTILVAVFAVNTTGNLTETIYWTKSTDGGKTWATPMPLTGGNGYPVGYTVQKERSPRLAYRFGGSSVEVAWLALYVNGTTALFQWVGLFYATLNFETGTLGSLKEIVTDKGKDFNNYYNLRFWEEKDSFLFVNYYHGLSYYNATDRNLYIWSHYLYYFGLNPVEVWATAFKNSTVAGVPAISLVFGYDIAWIDSFRYMLVFTRYDSNASKYVIYSTISGIDYKFSENLTSVVSGKAALYPFISYDSANDIIAVTYNSIQQGEFYTLEVVFSTDKGVSWGHKRTLDRKFVGIVEICDQVKTWKYNLNFANPQNTSNLETIYFYTTYKLMSTFSPNGAFFYAFQLKVYGYNGTLNTYYVQLKTLENNIAVFGTKNLNWAFTEIGDVREIAIGDSDGDALMEIAANLYDDGFTVFELKDSNIFGMTFSQVYIKEHLNNTVQDIAMGDSNGNGFDEVIVSTDYGNVYSYEFTNYNWQAANLKVPQKIQGFSSATIWSSSKYSGVLDVNSDGIEEMYVAIDNSNLILLSPYYSNLIQKTFTGALIRSVTSIATPSGDDLILLLDNGTFYHLDGFDLSIINKFDVGAVSPLEFVKSGEYLLVYNSSGFVEVYKVGSFSLLYSYNLNTTGILKASLGFKDGGIRNIILKFNNGTHIGLDTNTSKITWRINTFTSIIDKLLTLDLNNDGVYEFVTLNRTSTDPEQYEILVVSAFTGDVLYSIETEINSINWAYQFDIDNDEYPEVLIASTNGLLVFTTKTFELVWETALTSSLVDVQVRDFNGDNLTDIMYQVDLGKTVVVGNQYGAGLIVYQDQTLKMVSRIMDIDGDGSKELTVYMSNGTIASFTIQDFSSTYTAIAYRELSKSNEIKVFDGESIQYLDGIIVSGDLDGIGADDIVVSNGTHIAGLTINNVLFSIDTNTTVLGILVGDYYSLSSGTEIIYWNSTHVMILANDGTLISSKLVIQTSQDFIKQVFLEDFDGDGLDEILTVTNTTMAIYQNNLEVGPRAYPQGEVYTIVGDWNGDSKTDIAVKFLTGQGRGYLYIVNGSLAAYYVKLLATSGPNLYLPDIFALDYDNDGTDELLFFNMTGEIDIINTNGSTKVINTGIKNYAQWVGKDMMLNTPGGLAIKYAYSSFVIIDNTGTVLFEVKDASNTKYVPVDVENDGSYEYFGMTESKLFGISTIGILYYNKIVNQTSGFTILREAGEEIYIAVLRDDGIVDIYKKTAWTTVYDTGIAEENTNNVPNGIQLIIPITMITATITILTIIALLTRKRKIKTIKTKGV